MAFSFCATVIVLFLSLLSTNIAHWQGHVILYTLPIGLGSLGLSLAGLSARRWSGSAGVAALGNGSGSRSATYDLLPGPASRPCRLVAMVFMDRLGDVIESVNGPQALLLTLWGSFWYSTC